MKLDCPSCGSGYEVSASLFAAGPRRVRCRSCGFVFEGRIPEAPQAVAPLPSRTGPGIGARLAAVAAGLAGGLVAGAAAALFLLPGAMQRLADLPGLPAPARAMAGALDVPGLAALAPAPPRFSVVVESVRRAAAGAEGALEVAGEIRNLTRASRAAPAVELTLLDAGGRALDVIRLPAGPGPIPAGQSAGFSTVALNPPAATARIAVRIADGPLDRL